MRLVWVSGSTKFVLLSFNSITGVVFPTFDFDDTLSLFSLIDVSYDEYTRRIPERRWDVRSERPTKRRVTYFLH